MAGPMVHLSVAHELVCTCGFRPRPAFYLGSIAPDAIHMRPDFRREDKRATHLSQDAFIELSRVRELVAESWRTGENAPFVEGYCVHLLTDRYWVHEFKIPLEVELDGQMPQHEVRALYDRECHRVDHELYDQEPWRGDVWALLRSAEAAGFQGLTRQEIELWRDRTLCWYDEHQHERDYPSRHITVEMALGFIEEASAHACEQMAQWRRSVAGSR